jgi:hypothetical protein
LKTRLRGRRLLAETVPFRYAGPGERPVGLRGFFLVRVFEDTGDSLAPRLDLSSHVRRVPNKSGPEASTLSGS